MSFDGPLGQAADELLLEAEVEQHHGQGGQHGAGTELAPKYLFLSAFCIAQSPTPSVCESTSRRKMLARRNSLKRLTGRA